MKKNKVFIFLTLVCVLQLIIPVSIVCMRETASEKGLQGKMKVSGVWYSSIKETLDFDASQIVNKKEGTGNYIPVHLDENGYIVLEDRTAVKPEGAYINREIFRTRSTEYEKHQLDFIMSEEELNRLTLIKMSELNYDGFYVTVSVYEGELIFKELWLDDTKLVEFL